MKTFALLSFALVIAVACGFRYEVRLGTNSGFVQHSARLFAIVEHHNISLNDYFVHPLTQYSRIADIAVPAPRLKNAAFQYFNYSPFMNITVQSFVVVPVYLAEPYRSQLTKRFPVPATNLKPGLYNMTA